MAEDFSGEKTEKATPRRREDARKKGEVAKSREIPSVMVLLTGLLVLFITGQSLVSHLEVLSANLFNRAGTLTLNPSTVQALSRDLIYFLLLVLVPIFLAVVAMAVLSNYVQVGSLIAPQAVKPDLNKINIFQGLKRLFALQSWVELLKSIGKLLIIGGVAYGTIHRELPEIVPLVDQALPDIAATIFRISFSIFIKAVLVMAAAGRPGLSVSTVPLRKKITHVPATIKGRVQTGGRRSVDQVAGPHHSTGDGPKKDDGRGPPGRCDHHQPDPSGRGLSL